MPAANQTDKPILEVANLKMHFPIQKGFFQKTTGYVKAVDDVSFSIRHGETLGLVGESGCGKTTIGRCLVRAYKPTAGALRYRSPGGSEVDLARIAESGLKPYRRELRMIFQDPYSSLNPRMTVLDIVGEPLLVHRI